MMYIATTIGAFGLVCSMTWFYLSRTPDGANIGMIGAAMSIAILGFTGLAKLAALFG